MTNMTRIVTILIFLLHVPNHFPEYRIEHQIIGQLQVYSNSLTIGEAAVVVILNIDFDFLYDNTKQTIC